MSRRVLLRAFTLAVLPGCLMASRPASADTILYSTVNNGFRQSAGWQTHGFDEETGQDLQVSVAMPFRLPQTSTIRTIELGFDFDPTGEDFLQVDVLNAANGRPGSSVGAVSFDLPFFSTPTRLLTIRTDIALPAGQYFLSLRTSGDIVGTWWQTDGPFFGGWESVNEGPWFEQPSAAQGVFRLSGDVTSTPEPASLLLLGTGVAGLFGAARRRKDICAD